MPGLQEMARKEGAFASGHRLCAGCPVPIITKMLTRVTDYKIVAGSATGCLEVGSSIFPYSSWKVPWIHTAFENVAATISGVEAMYRVHKKKNKTGKKIKFVAIGGDGGTYDIGLQSLSGAMERGHDIVYLCYDNNAYANTGGQRSSATPLGASATTSPAGRAIPGKLQWRKDLTRIMAAHGLPYVAQGSIHRWQDLFKKAQKAFAIEGPAFLNVLCPCPTEWKYPESQGVKLARLAVETCAWPLYEVEQGKYRITYKPKEKLPVTEWLKPQGRFRHLFKEENAWMLEEIQKRIDAEWAELLRLSQIE